MSRGARFALAAALVAVVHPRLATAQTPDEDDPIDEVPLDAAPDAPADDAPVDADAPPPVGKGAVVGVVTDPRLGEPLFDAQIEVVGTKVTTFADEDGRFRLEVPPGSYTLRVSLEGYKPSRISGVRVSAGALARLDVAMEGESAAEDVIVVEAEPDRASVEAGTLARRRSAAAQDGVGRAEIAKTPDRNAAEAARRVVGTSIVGGRFVYVRGLGERYTNALLDGAPLPSPEPDRQAVPLDLFPTAVIDGVTIVKTFTPDVPGDFAGGSVRIDTRRMPEKPVLSLGLGLGLNTNASFAERVSTEGGALDWLGFDDGTRARPEEVPDHQLIGGIERPDGELITSGELTRAGRALNSDQRLQRTTSPPSHSGTLVAANTFELGEGHRLGAIAALTYARSFERRVGEVYRSYNVADGALQRRNDLRFESGTDRVGWGALGGLTYEPHPDHRFALTLTYSRFADDFAQDSEGFIDERGANIHETRSRFVQRGLAFGQLRGEHESPSTWNTQIRWNASLARATRDEPDTRGTIWQQDTGSGWVFEDDADSGLHFFGTQGESSFGGGLDVTQPLAPNEKVEDVFAVKVGGRVDVRERRFEARRYRYRPISGVDPRGTALVCDVDAWDDACPGDLFRDDAVGRLIQVEESTLPTDGYDADQGVYAGYVMVDGPLVDRVRVILGERLELSRQSISPFHPATGERTPDGFAELDADALLPAAALVVSPTEDLAIRVSGTRTVARPQLRELAPFQYTDFFGGRETRGNPELRISRIVNLDARLEWFPSLREVLAITGFLKTFDDPIETVVSNSTGGGLVTYQNSDAAILGGVELEARKNLGFLAQGLVPLTLVGNVTLAHSRVSLAEDAAARPTTPSRALSQQSPWVINAAVDFEEDSWDTSARIAWNVAGPRIVEVGFNGIPDTYEQPRHSLDLSVAQRFFGDHLELKGTVTNLLDDAFVLTAGPDRVGDVEDADGNIVRSFSVGQSFSLSAALSL